MSKGNLQTVFQNLGYFPHQAEFAAKFLAPDSAQKHLLQSWPGLGKGFTASAITGYVVTHDQARRVLVLAPPALVHQWLHMIRSKYPNASSMVIDRRRLRELEDNQERGESPWPTSGIILMSMDFARQEDVAESLLKTTWDLLVVDEAQLLTPSTQRRQVVTRLLDQSPKMRALFLRVHIPIVTTNSDVSTDPLFCDAETTVWSRETLRDKNGMALLPEVHIQWIPYHRRDDEVKLLSRLQHALQATQASDSRSQVEITTLLLQSASSSLFALEQRLNRMRRRQNEIAHGINENIHGVDEDDAERSADRPSLAQPRFIDQTVELLEMLDNIATDSKFESLLSLLDDIGVVPSSERRVCMFTSYVDTATYLESALSEYHPCVTAITGNLSYAERERTVANFMRNGGILIATLAMSTTIPEVAAVIFYDLPLNPITTEARIGQFVRVGRRGPVQVFAFTDDSNSLAIEQLQKKVVEAKAFLREDELQQLLVQNADLNSEDSLSNQNG